MNLPNRITLMRIACVPVYLALQAVDTPACRITAAAVFAVAALSDYADGFIARKRGLVTVFGKFMDPIADKVLVFSALVLLCAQQRANVWAVILLMSREFIVSGFRLVAASAGSVLAANRIAKWKTATQLAAVILLSLTLLLPGNLLLWASAVLSVWSGGAYISRNREVLMEKKANEHDR